jgi:DNA polymerase-3 subunit alpha
MTEAGQMLPIDEIFAQGLDLLQVGVAEWKDEFFFHAEAQSRRE